MPADYSAFYGGFRREEEEDKGFLATIFDEIGKDIKGAAKFVTAATFMPADALGIEVPVAFDDLGMRDYQGAAMVASLFVGGGIAAGAKAALGGGSAGARVLGTGAARAAARETGEAWARQATWRARAALFGSSEAAAGAFYGSLRPLQSGEERLEALVGDAVFFGAFGGGLSVLGSGMRATMGVRLAQIKGTHRAALLQNAAKRSESARSLSEYAGITLRNLDSGADRKIFRTADGSIRVWEGQHKFTFESFDDALSDSFNNGFTSRQGLARETLD
ncbi:MAG: hypothetical protein GTN93_02735, partial [Anaerolineae bacterium]|nr:hypothetical protein [Anaerolineae bacterium]